MKKQIFVLAFATLAMQAAPAFAYSSDYWRHHEDGARYRGHGQHNGRRNGTTTDAATTTTTGGAAVDEATDAHVGDEN